MTRAFLLDVGYATNGAYDKKKRWFEQEEPRRIIHLVCKDEEGGTVVVRVPDWRPWVYVKRQEGEGDRFFSWLKERFAKAGCVHAESTTRQQFVGFSNGREHAFAKLRFKVWPLPPMVDENLAARVMEGGRDAPTKFLHESGLRCGGWFEWSGGDEARMSTLRPLPEVCTPPKLVVCAWDLETTSLLPTKGKIHQVCLIFHDTCAGPIADRDPRSVVICTQPTASVEGTPVLVVANEKQLLLKMRALIRRHDPDVLTGFNTGAFDISFLRHRLSQYDGVESFFDISRIPNTKAYFREKTLQNSAMGTNQRTLLCAYGRLNVDLWLYAKQVRACPTWAL